MNSLKSSSLPPHSTPCLSVPMSSIPSFPSHAYHLFLLIPRPSPPERNSRKGTFYERVEIPGNETQHDTIDRQSLIPGNETQHIRATSRVPRCYRLRDYSFIILDELAHPFKRLKRVNSLKSSLTSFISTLPHICLHPLPKPSINPIQPRPNTCLPPSIHPLHSHEHAFSHRLHVMCACNVAWYVTRKTRCGYVKRCNVWYITRASPRHTEITNLYN